MEGGTVAWVMAAESEMKTKSSGNGGLEKAMFSVLALDMDVLVFISACSCRGRIVATWIVAL